MTRQNRNQQTAPAGCPTQASFAWVGILPRLVAGLRTVIPMSIDAAAVILTDACKTGAPL